MEASTHAKKPHKSSKESSNDFRNMSESKSSTFDGKQLFGTNEKEMELIDVPEIEFQADPSDDDLVRSSIRVDTMYNSLKQELYVISEEDQTSYKETNLQESLLGS